MKIEVTQEHIDNGVACSVGLCPVALAVGQAGLLRVAVLDVVLCYQGETYVEAKLPKEVKEFIENFDNGDFSGVAPLSFDLDFKPVLL